jgi:hypothetical protein
MRMKLNKSSQLVLVSAASLLAAGLVTACGTLTVDFVFVASSRAAGLNNFGEIDVFEVNSESGRMRQIPTSPFPSGGRDPVAEAVTTDHQDLFVANYDDNTVAQFVIGNDGKIYPYNTVNTPGVYPIALAVNGLNLFVVDTYQPLPTCSTASPCSGSIGVFPITAATSNLPDAIQPLSLPNGSQYYWPLCLTGYAQTSGTWNCKSTETHVLVPTAVTVLASGTQVYIAAYDSTAAPETGYVFGFTVGAGGALTPVTNGPPTVAGIQPSGIASGSTSNGNYVYVTDFIAGKVLGFSAGSSGTLTALPGSPYPAGNQPSAIVVDPSSAYPYAYVTNSQDATVEAYSISSSNGALSFAGGSSTPVLYSTGLQPVAVGIDPSLNHYLYTINFLGNNVSGFQLSATNGTLLDSQFSPYPSNANPTAVAAIPHQ